MPSFPLTLSKSGIRCPSSHFTSFPPKWLYVSSSSFYSSLLKRRVMVVSERGVPPSVPSSVLSEPTNALTYSTTTVHNGLVHSKSLLSWLSLGVMSKKGSSLFLGGKSPFSIIESESGTTGRVFWVERRGRKEE